MFEESQNLEVEGDGAWPVVCRIKVTPFVCSEQASKPLHKAGYGGFRQGNSEQLVPFLVVWMVYCGVKACVLS